MDIRAQDLIPEDMERLPQSVRDIASVAGVDAALACVNAFGGMQVSIPKGENNNSQGRAAFARLEAVVGKEAALAICDEFGGEVVGIPFCHQLRKEIRNRAIRIAFDDGANVDALVKQFSLTYRAIEVILNRAY